jgi:hypothetical protein
MRGLRNILNHFRHAKSNTALVVGIFVFGALAFGGLGLAGSDSAQASANPDNDIVRGGIYNRDLAGRCSGDIRTIMNHYRIDCNLSGVVDGRACRDGNVYVGGRVVARQAQSIGRMPIQGSHTVSIGGNTYHETPNSAAFLSDCLDTFVKLDQNGSFTYAIIKACGNPIFSPAPVVVTPPKPPPPPKPPVVVKIQVCDLRTKRIVVIKESDYRSNLHSRNLADCKTVVVKKYIQVCLLSSKSIVQIEEKDFDSSKHSRNLADCKTVVVNKRIQVCVIASRTIMTIDEKDFSATLHSTNLSDCQPCQYDSTLSKDSESCVPPATPVTPATPQLPQTGIGDSLMSAGVGIGSLIVAGSAYIGSRKDLLSSFLNR